MGTRRMVDGPRGVIRREGLKGGNDDDTLPPELVEKGESRETGWSLGFAVIRIAV